MQVIVSSRMRRLVDRANFNVTLPVHPLRQAKTFAVAHSQAYAEYAARVRSELSGTDVSYTVRIISTPYSAVGERINSPALTAYRKVGTQATFRDSAFHLTPKTVVWHNPRIISQDPTFFMASRSRRHTLAGSISQLEPLRCDLVVECVRKAVVPPPRIEASNVERRMSSPMHKSLAETTSLDNGNSQTRSPAAHNTSQSMLGNNVVRRRVERRMSAAGRLPGAPLAASVAAVTARFHAEWLTAHVEQEGAAAYGERWRAVGNALDGAVLAAGAQGVDAALRVLLATIRDNVYEEVNTFVRKQDNYVGSIGVVASPVAFVASGHMSPVRRARGSSVDDSHRAASPPKLPLLDLLRPFLPDGPRGINLKRRNDVTRSPPTVADPSSRLNNDSTNGPITNMSVATGARSCAPVDNRISPNQLKHNGTYEGAHDANCVITDRELDGFDVRDESTVALSLSTRRTSMRSAVALTNRGLTGVAEADVEADDDSIAPTRDSEHGHTRLVVVPHEGTDEDDGPRASWNSAAGARGKFDALHDIGESDAAGITADSDSGGQDDTEEELSCREVVGAAGELEEFAAEDSAARIPQVSTSDAELRLVASAAHSGAVSPRMSGPFAVVGAQASHSTTPVHTYPDTVGERASQSTTPVHAHPGTVAETITRNESVTVTAASLSLAAMTATLSVSVGGAGGSGRPPASPTPSALVRHLSGYRAWPQQPAAQVSGISDGVTVTPIASASPSATPVLSFAPNAAFSADVSAGWGGVGGAALAEQTPHASSARAPLSIRSFRYATGGSVVPAVSFGSGTSAATSGSPYNATGSAGGGYSRGVSASAASATFGYSSRSLQRDGSIPRSLAPPLSGQHSTSSARFHVTSAGRSGGGEGGTSVPASAAISATASSHGGGGGGTTSPSSDGGSTTYWNLGGDSSRAPGSPYSAAASASLSGIAVMRIPRPVAAPSTGNGIGAGEAPGDVALDCAVSHTSDAGFDSDASMHADDNAGSSYSAAASFQKVRSLQVEPLASGSRPPGLPGQAILTALVAPPRPALPSLQSRIPNLSLSLGATSGQAPSAAAAAGFQEEFMANAAEWSLSWREFAAKQPAHGH